MAQSAEKIAITGAEIYPWSAPPPLEVVPDPVAEQPPLLNWNRAHPDEPIADFQIFGERRSGTNYAHELLAKNLKIAPNFTYGWKHGFPVMPAIQRSSLIVGVFRDPINWLISLHNRPFSPSHRGLEFSEFLRKSWFDIYKPRELGHKKFGHGGMPAARGVLNQLDRHPITGKEFANPLEMRSLKYAAYAGFMERDCNVVLLDYATLRDRPVEVLDAIREQFGIAKTKGAPKAIAPVGPGGKDKPRQVASEIAAEDLDFIRSNLDEPLERSLGYGAVFYETPV